MPGTGLDIKVKGIENHKVLPGNIYVNILFQNKITNFLDKRL